MKLYLARHGQTSWNALNIICGRTDIPLTEEGLAQAQRLADQAVGKGIQEIWCSPLLRARQTAQPTADRLNLPIQIDERLLEMSFGDFEGTDRFAEAYFRQRKELLIRFPGGGESVADTIYRAYSVLEDIRVNHPDRTILLVTHGSFSRAIHSYFHPTTLENYFKVYIKNAQLMEYEFPAR